MFIFFRTSSGSIKTLANKGIDIILTLDTSGSMKAEDFKPQNRLGAAKKVLEIEASQPENPLEIYEAAAGSKAREMYETGNLDIGIISCGQGVGMIHDIPTVKELYDRIVKEASLL